MKREQGYVAGVDTGGTFTDAVILDPEGRVAARAKRPTRHDDLEAGIVESLGAALASAKIRGGSLVRVGVSTTLATNSIVEGRGARVGLFQIGVRKPVRLPVVSVEFVQGGHSVGGGEDAPLDLQALLGGVGRFKGHVDSYAVAASGSCFNPAHELVAQKAIAMLDPKPVSCAHQVSELPSHEERLATVALNAGLLPVMEYFLERLQSGLARLGATAPVLVACGDGGALTPEQARQKPLSTFAAGPAASALYGAQQAGLRGAGNAVVVDVGGTTTDLITVRDGGLPVRSGGAFIGGWETHVRTVELRTVGIGGDSHVRVNPLPGRIMQVGPRRVRPLALAGLSTAAGPARDVSGGLLDRLLQGDADRVVFIAPQARERAQSLAATSRLLALLLERGVATLEELARNLGRNMIELERRLGELSRARLLVEAGFTPSDALHVLGQAHFGDADAAKRGAAILAARCGLDAEAFCRRVLDEASRGVEEALVEHLLRCELGHDMAGLVRRRSELKFLRLEIRPTVPVVALGAAGPALLAGLGERLGAELIFPEEYEVGNACGAALVAARAVQDNKERA